MQPKSKSFVASSTGCYLCPFRPTCSALPAKEQQNLVAVCPILSQQKRALLLKGALDFFYNPYEVNQVSLESLKYKLEGLDPACLN